MDYWMSTKSNPKMLDISTLTPEIENYLRNAIGVDATTVAKLLGTSDRAVKKWRRELGLENIKSRPNRKPKKGPVNPHG